MSSTQEVIVTWPDLDEDATALAIAEAVKAATRPGEHFDFEKYGCKGCKTVTVEVLAVVICSTSSKMVGLLFLFQMQVASHMMFNLGR